MKEKIYYFDKQLFFVDYKYINDFAIENNINHSTLSKAMDRPIKRSSKYYFLLKPYLSEDKKVLENRKMYIDINLVNRDFNSKTEFMQYFNIPRAYTKSYFETGFLKSKHLYKIKKYITFTSPTGEEPKKKYFLNPNKLILEFGTFKDCAEQLGIPITHIRNLIYKGIYNVKNKELLSDYLCYEKVEITDDTLKIIKKTKLERSVKRRLENKTLVKEKLVKKEIEIKHPTNLDKMLSMHNSGLRGQELFDYLYKNKHINKKLYESLI